MKVNVNRELTRFCMSDEVLKHTNMTMERIMELVYGGIPVNIRYDPYNRCYWCDIIKYTADPVYVEDETVEELTGP